MRKFFAIAIAGVIGVAGYAETTPRAHAADGRAAPRSIDEIRANALAEMQAGNLMEVRKGRRAGRSWRGGRSFRGGRSYRGRSFRGGRNWRGRGYGYRRHYGGRRYYRGRRGYGGAVAAGVAGFALGAIAADAARSAPRSRSKQWCANRYRSYDWASGTYVTYDGVRRACP
ncbi:BA14K family protein [Chenggangzhangella methanolivorans]|uniref:Lectin-like protein BA14k n=1 Tax=Chenggangzhangella methanolivorans TaxID=1437009 RepID=A0A9E6UGY9_9HYPH|nr:BA14K family protein [Chenggangzhangella methanolivorans]QZN99237.1 BA14K family protein [Chenggangzhangella methanolivorans]